VRYWRELKLTQTPKKIQKENQMYDYNSNGFNFPVEMQPIYDRIGNPIPDQKCVMRTDTNEVLGVHGSRYQIVTHDDVVNSMMDALKTANVSQDYETKFTVVENGRKLRGEILFNDLVVEPKVGDYVKFRISFFNSYDASWAFSQAADGLRLWCLNGCTSPMHAAQSRFKHTQSINIEGSAMKMINALDTFMTQPDQWREWMSARVTTDMAETFFKATVAKAYTMQQAGKTNERQLEKLLSIYSNEADMLGSNKWALYNCLTYWASHTSDLKNPEVARRNREDAISKAMQHKLWGEIV
jgi:hypothetical protein